ncbi:helix-turn-helix transcriptional regulator [Chitinophaga sp. RAB17]|uniref:helix-turn-helix transcriptional regulator n=1 Tax=Chitinophaga sp. RAB17 TaxID=3233049 RepID=UPI003F8E5D37
MKFLLHSLLICIYISLSLDGFTQTEAAENSQSGSKNVLSGNNQPDVLYQQAETFRVNKNYAAARSTVRQSIQTALQIKNYTAAAKAYALLVSIKANSRELATLTQTSDSAMLIAQRANDPVAMAYAYYARVLVYKTLDDPENMVKNCQSGLKELEKRMDHNIAARCYYQLYVVNSDWNNEAKVNFYARKATEHILQTKDYNMLSNCYTALSVAHEYNYNTQKEKQELDSTLFYLSQSEALYRQYPGHVADYTYAITCINIANCYMKYFPETDGGAKAQAIHFANTARTALKDTSNSQEVVASSLGILSEYARRENNSVQEERYLLDAYEVMKTEQPPYYYTMINVVRGLSGFYKRKGDYQKALDYQEKVTEYSNKNFSEKQAQNAQKLEIQYETEKKDNEMRILKEREKSRMLQNYLYACIALASLLGLVFMFRSYHFRLRFSMQREKQLQLEKQDSELQIKLQKEEQARLRAEQQLMETQQQQLQKEVMANVLHLEHKNRMLLDIKDKLSEGGSVNMQKILKEELVIDNDFENAKLQIQRVHPDFFNLINEKSQRNLSPLDLKLCAYLYLKMDTRQIAQLMHIEAKSVRMSRYRIKQKLGLGKDEDLNIFLQGLGN